MKGGGQQKSKRLVKNEGREQRAERAPADLWDPVTPAVSAVKSRRAQNMTVLVLLWTRLEHNHYTVSSLRNITFVFEGVSFGEHI